MNFDETLLFSQHTQPNFTSDEIPLTPINNDFSKNFISKQDFFFDQDIKSDKLKEESAYMYNYCNQTLANYGFSALGELQGEYLNLEKTIKVIYELIQQRQRDLEFRNEIIDKMAKLESDKNNYNQTINRLKLELENQKKSNGQLENTNKLTEKKTRNEKDKLLYEKDELQKQIFRLNSKETQMLHEIRKKENEINKLKEQLRKNLNDKIPKINFEIINNYNSSANIIKSSENELINSYKENFERIRQKLLSENQELRNTLISLQNNMNRIINKYKDEFISKRKNEGIEKTENLINYFSDIDLISMKNEVFSLPYEQIGCEIISIFNNNFKTIERFLDKLVNFDICKYIIDFLSKEFYEYDQLFKKIEKFNDLRQFLGHNKK